MQQNLQMGQINVVLALMVLVDVTLPNKHPAKGILIGIGAGMKLTPALVAVYYFVTGQWRSGLRAFGTFLATALIGFALWPTWSWSYWTAHIFENRIGPNHLGNQSLLGTVGRLVMAANGPATAVRPLWLLLSLLVVGVCLLVLRRSNQDAHGLTFCALAATILLVSPLSWSPHWILLAPAVVLCVRSAPGTKARVAVALGLGLLAFAWPVNGVWSGLLWTVYPAEFWHPPTSPAWHGLIYYGVASSYTIIGLITLIVCLQALRRQG